MSVTFVAAGTTSHLEVNLSNVNARDLLSWLGYEAVDLWGELPARDLAARCRRRLWPESRNLDPALVPAEDRSPDRATSILLGRPEGYLRSRTEQLLALAELAGDGAVSFS